MDEQRNRTHLIQHNKPNSNTNRGKRKNNFYLNKYTTYFLKNSKRTKTVYCSEENGGKILILCWKMVIYFFNKKLNGLPFVALYTLHIKSLPCTSIFSHLIGILF